MPKKPPAKVGRPTLYDAKVHPGIVAKLAAEGKTVEELANVLGVDGATFYRWQGAHPEFREAVSSGKAAPIAKVEDALFRLSTGYVYEEEGRKRVKHADIRAIEFYLKNVCPDKWREVTEVKTGMTKEMQAQLTSLLNEALRENVAEGDVDRVMKWLEERVGVDG